jgi:hypothetical protein
MKTNFETNRKGIKINLEVIKLNEQNKLCVSIKINNEKIFGDLDTEKKAITFAFYQFPKMQRKINGISLGELETEIMSIYQELKLQKESIVNELVKDIVSGKGRIKFSLIGCDYKYFSPNINTRSTDIIKIDEYDVMNKAITELLGESANWECLQHSRIVKEHEGTEDFELTLVEVLEKRINVKKEKEEKLNLLFNKAKETGEKQEITHYTTECNNPIEECNIDIVYEYAMPDGTRKIERIHTY